MSRAPLCARAVIRSAKDDSGDAGVAEEKHAAADRLVVLPIPITLSAVVMPRWNAAPGLARESRSTPSVETPRLVRVVSEGRG